MIYKNRFLSFSSENPKLFFQPAPAWLAMLILILLTTLGIMTGIGKILNIAFPLGALAVGGFLYIRYPLQYIGFIWWLWFLTPFVRRLVDFRSGYTEGSPLLIAPYLVTALTFITFLRYLPKLQPRMSLPFALPIAGVFYGFFIGLIKNPSPFLVTREFLDWLTPLTFGFHLYVNWQKFPNYYQLIQRVFVWGVIVMGSYGVVQFLIAPEWDVFWLVNSGMTSANGYPDSPIPGPLSIRVFSTMASTEPFGAFTAASLLLLFSCQGILRFPASVAGYLSILLTLMRSAWLGWFAGLLTYISSLRGKYQIRAFTIILVMALLIVPFTMVEPFSGAIGSRLESLSNINEDSSAVGRQEAFKNNIGKISLNFLGDGIGSGGSDNIILALFQNLGWLGIICYVSGMLMLVKNVFQYSDKRSSIFLATSRAIIMSCLIRIPANAISILGIGGLLLWGFFGLNLAFQKYSQQQSKT